MEVYEENTFYDYYIGNQTDNATYDLIDIVDCPSSNLHGSNIYLPILYFLMFFTGFFGNLFVIIVIGTKGRRGSRLVDTFVVNLALADLVFVLTLPLWAISANQDDHWNFGPLGNVLCKLSSYIIAVNRFSNIFFLTCMSVDRYLAVVKLLDSRFLRSGQCIRLTCAAVWLISLVLGTPSLVYRNVKWFNNKPSCSDEQSPFFTGLSLTTVFLTFALPVLIVFLCYGTILVHLQKHSVGVANPRASARRRHSLKMVLTILLFFVVSWFPFNLFKTIIIFSHLSDADLSCYTQSWQRNGLILSCCLAFLNSCVNPAIYFFLDHHFRRNAENLYMSCLGRQKLTQNTNSSASFTNNGTSESFGTTALRSRRRSFD